jgi:signal transduction histidine kinase
MLTMPIAAEAKDLSHPVVRSDNRLKVGVRAIKGIAVAKITWTKTIDVLNENIKDYQFELVPIVGFNEMKNAAKNKEIDFILTNPLAYIELKKQSGLTRILTLNKKQPNGIASAVFAAVIFTRSDRNDMLSLDDLRNKSIIGVHEEAFGGWRMALRELLHHDFDPYADSSKVLFTPDNSHQSVVYSVLSGDADVGTVRTGVIEQLVAQGKIKADSIKVLNSQHDKLPVLHSTQLYPEWPFAVLPHVKSTLSNSVFHALLGIQAESPAAMAGKYVNWTAPLDYSEVYNLSNELAQQHITLANIWDKHWLTILIFQAFVIAIIFYTFYLFAINKKLILSEQELSQHRDHLEDIVTARTEELISEKKKAERANKAKSEFLSNMSHELRTPLNAILGFSELMKLDENNSDHVYKNADKIMIAGDYLLSLINEILDLSVIESGKAEFNLEKISCNEILSQSLDIISPLAVQKNITINITNPSQCFVFADHRRLQQICINLLSNAIKYNTQDGNINIVIEQNNKHECKFSIKDSGVGIKAEFYNKVFQPFSRHSEHSDTIKGTGIGLVITKQLVEQMQGTIGFKSEYGVGSEFWVTLPAIEV